MLLRLLKKLLKPASKGSELDAQSLNLLQEAEAMAAGGDVAGALRKCQGLPSGFANHPEIQVRRATWLAQSGAFKESEVCLRQVLDENPNQARALFLLGSLYLAQGDAPRSLPLFAQAELVGEADEALLANQGVALHATGNTLAARQKLEAALRRAPAFMAAAVPLCQILIEQKTFEEALVLLDRLLEGAGNNGRLLRLKGFILYKHFFDPIGADRLLAQAAQLGENETQFWNERGECARDLGDSTRALEYFDQALALSPGHPVVTFNKALLDLMLENYAEGWPGYEARFDGSNQGNIQLPAPLWNGKPLGASSLVVMGEQGLGDEIMFASCLPDLPKDARVTLVCAEKLLEIFRASFPHIACVAREHATVQSVDGAQFAIAAGSLPRIFRREKAAFPRKPYLRAPEASRQTVAAFLTGLPAGMKVGISWRGGTEASRRRLRSLPLAELAGLLEEPGITWVNLQYGECDADLKELQKISGRKIHHDQAILDDYAQTAALVEGLDLVISVCTAIIHLGGALGKEVWVLAPSVPEWRYGMNFPFMPWYRQVEIFRQEESGEWEAPLGMVRDRLAVYQAKKSPSG